MSHKNLYSFWDNKTDELLCFELPADRCCDILKMSESSFHGTVSRCRTGKNGKYHVEVVDSGGCAVICNPTFIYTVKDKETGQIIAENESSRICSEKMGIKFEQFDYQKKLCRKGKNKKWEILQLEKGKSM